MASVYITPLISGLHQHSGDRLNQLITAINSFLGQSGSIPQSVTFANATIGPLGLLVESAAAGLTAHAGGTQAAGLPLTSMMNQISVCATGGDSVVLPASVAGLQITVINNGAASCNVFPPVGSSMNTVANAASALAAGAVGIYTCFTATGWSSK